MDIITINRQITDNIILLRKIRDQLKFRADDKAKALGEYEKKLAVTILKLRNSESVEFEGETITNPPVSIIEKLAKGICYKESIARDIAESNYKNAIIGLQSVQAIINALQSMLRYVDES